MEKSGFPQEVLAEAKALEISKSLLQGRKPAEGITIDGPFSRDLDDAINIEQSGAGLVIQVSIADVSDYIKPGSLLFEEALKRVATNYLKNYNIPMLPHSISENSLSLLAYRTRPALTFFITINDELEVLNTEICKTALKNRRRFNYSQVDNIIDSKPDDPDYKLLNGCYTIARRLMDSRKKRGALAIYDLQQLLFSNEEGRLIRMNSGDAHKSNIIVQEFMILANMVAAELAAERGYLFLFRNHTARQSTPRREEILEQIATASANPQLYLDTLNKRSSLWFNKAVYEPVLKGHYGLNLPAYTHITSPLRRITDLINQGLLKAQFFGAEAAFNSEELLKVSSEINTSIQIAAEEKENYFKEKARLEARGQIENSRAEIFISMGANDFKRILKEACRSRIMTPELAEAIRQKIAGEGLGAEHLALLLFESPDEPGVWGGLRSKALEAAINSSGRSKQILYLQSQAGIILDFDIEFKEYKGGFAARAIAELDGERKSTPFYLIGYSKKEAQNAASNEFLKNYLSKTLVLADNTVEPDDTSIFGIEIPGMATNDFSNEEPEENYVGKLGELCISLEPPSQPAYEFVQSGPGHNPAITCKCTLNTEYNFLWTTASSSSKKSAKQFAAKKMLGELLKYQPDEPDVPEEKGINIVEAKADEIIEENYIGLVNDKCMQSEWPLPQYKFSIAGPAHQPLITCTATVICQGQKFNVTGSASNKKLAKQTAARELWNKIG